MLAAIAATWASVCVRAFLAYGISRSIDHRSTLSAATVVFDFRQPLARGRAHALTEGKCWRFYPPADPLQAALRLAPLIIPMIDFIQTAPAIQSAPGSRRALDAPLRGMRR
jgi:hypothetical protein